MRSATSNPGAGDGGAPLDAAVVLVNYNGRGMLGGSLDSLARQRGVRFETIVVDNDSADGLPWDEAEGRPGVRVIRNADNVGFGAGLQCRAPPPPRRATWSS